MNVATVWGIARAEARLTRRLVRYWIFVALAALAWILSFVYYGVLHTFFSSYSASAGVTSPTYLTAAFGLWYLTLLNAGLVCLAFDVRHRDVRERVSEVLDSRPFTNAEQVLGKLVGLLLAAWIPTLAIAALLYAGGSLAGETPQLVSLASFLVCIALPTFAVVIAFVFFVSLATGNRWIALAAGIAAVFGDVGSTLVMPFYVTQSVELTGIYSVPFPSDILPVFLSGSAAAQRGAVLLLAAGLAALAVALHPRPAAGSRRRPALAGAALLVAGVAVLGLLVAAQRADLDQRDSWRSAHEARAAEPVPDLRRIAGSAVLRPGKDLSLDLEVGFAAPAEGLGESALFTLNPGLRVTAVSDSSSRASGGGTSGGRALDFEQGDGLLEVRLPRPLAPGEETAFTLKAAGEPDMRFAYLDDKAQLLTRSGLDTQLFILGYTGGLLEPRFTALMPGIRWLPASGVEVGRDDPRSRPRDFFELDLTVDLPRRWVPAGPGRRQELPDAAEGRSRYRFAPAAPLPEAALVAAEFERRGAEVEGVAVEILLHPGHAGNLEVFAEAEEEILAAVGERLAEARELGLAYPYGALSLVEVPNTLRGFGGGWRLDTALAPPGLLLLKETSFPTTRFARRFADREALAAREGGVARAQLQVLETFFENDFNGGNVFSGFARNLFLHQTAAEGPAALALDHVTNDLANRLVTGKDSYFSAYLFDRNLGSSIGEMFSGAGSEDWSASSSLIRALTDKPEVWEQALGVALADLDPHEDPQRTVNVLVLKGGAFSRSLADGLGRDGAAGLLAVLRARHAGSTYDLGAFAAAAAEAGLDLEQVGDWLEQTDLPGFVASDPELYRLPDSEDGSPRYQLSLHLHNGEQTPGLVRLRYQLGGEGDRRPTQQGDAVRVPAGEAAEVGLVTSEPPHKLWVSPYLSLNRGAFEVPLPRLDGDDVTEAEPLVGARPSAWRPSLADEILVDDLDPGFSVEQPGRGGGLRLAGRGSDQPLDQGLPIPQLGRVGSEWSRRSTSTAFGRYRHTRVEIRAGKGEAKAVFSAELPTAGRYRVEYYLQPSSRGRLSGDRLGTFHLTLADASGTAVLELDAQSAEDGWNSLGEHELARGAVRLEVSDSTDGTAVLADAVRLRPVFQRPAEEDADEAP